MILPVTYVAVLFLLIASALCLGSWINTFKATGARWRFELFSVDFAVGALLLAVIAAYTLGTLGSDLAFSDRILVAGRTAQALALIAGAVFNLGIMLLLASVSLLGISNAFPLTVGMALIVSSCFHFRPGSTIYLVIGIIVMLVGIVFEIRAARLREAAIAAAAKKENPALAAAQPSSPAPTATATVSTAEKPANATVRHSRHHSRRAALPAKKRKPRRSVRGIVAGLVGGIALGFFVPILNTCVPGDLGLGPYAGMLLVGIAVLISTIVYNFYFLNITIEGVPLTFGAYLKGTLWQHLLGFLGGALCLGGLLAAALALSAPATAGVPPFLRILLPILSVPLAFLFGMSIWNELKVTAKARNPLSVGLCLFLCALALFALGY